MRFKIDENLPIDVADMLRNGGHDAITVAEQLLAGHPDLRIAEACRAEKRALVTLDLDFSDIRTYPPHLYSGIIVLRPSVQSIRALTRQMAGVVDLLSSEPLEGRLWIVDDHRVRIRESL